MKQKKTKYCKIVTKNFCQPYYASEDFSTKTLKTDLDNRIFQLSVIIVPGMVVRGKFIILTYNFGRAILHYAHYVLLRDSIVYVYYIFGLLRKCFQ